MGDGLGFFGGWCELVSWGGLFSSSRYQSLGVELTVELTDPSKAKSKWSVAVHARYVIGSFLVTLCSVV